MEEAVPQIAPAQGDDLDDMPSDEEDKEEETLTISIIPREPMMMEEVKSPSPQVEKRRKKKWRIIDELVSF